MHTKIRIVGRAFMAWLIVAHTIATAAASPAGPMILVNTESFSIISDADVTDDVELRFGYDLGEKIYFDRSQSRFQITDQVYVENGLEVAEVMSGRSLHVSQDTALANGNVHISSSGSVTINDEAKDVDVRVESVSNPNFLYLDASTNKIGVGTVPGARFHIKGGGVGEKFRYETSQTPYSLRIGGNFMGSQDEVAITSGARVETHAADTTNAAWALQFSGLNDYFSLMRGSNNGQDVAVTWTEHMRMDSSGDVSIGMGANNAKTKLEVGGTISGSALTVSGLRNCDTIDTDANGVLSCGSDATGGGSSGGGGGLVDHYVNAGGDSMTGALSIDIAGTSLGTALSVQEHAQFNSGATLSGALTLVLNGDPAIPSDDQIKLYSKKVSGRALMKVRGPSGLDYPLQPSFFQNQICMLSAGAGTTINAVGCSATNDTTVSHPATTETYGFMSNFATSTTANDTAGSSQNVTAVIRGSTAGANGFFFYARVGVVDNTSIRLFTGLANQTIATMVGNDNPAGHHTGFQFSTNRADTNWMFDTKNNTTQTTADTGMPVTAANVYDMYMFCEPQCSTIHWRVDNLTAGTTAEGEATSTLPGNTTAMRMVTGVSTLTTAARNYRMQRLYVESDR